jgi:endonuclease G
MTGPIYEDPTNPLPNADDTHTVPSHFWKILAGYDAHGLWVASFIFAQTTPRNADIEDHLVSVDEVETRSGLDFFRELDDADEGVLEATAPTVAEWTAILPTRGCPAPVR